MRDEAGHILSVASFVGLGLGDAISVIARARNTECSTVLSTYWVDL